MKPVLLCSPFSAPDTKQLRENLNYARRAMKHSLALDEAPLPPHLLYPMVLQESDAADRQRGIACGLAWLGRCEALIVYADLGISSGMQEEISFATSSKIPIEFRYIIQRKAPQRSSIPK
jgi:hypothetical protein